MNSLAELTVEDIVAFVRGMGKDPEWNKIAEIFSKKKIDGTIIELSTEEDLIELGIEKLHSRAILKKI